MPARDHEKYLLSSLDALVTLGRVLHAGKAHHDRLVDDVVEEQRHGGVDVATKAKAIGGDAEVGMAEHRLRVHRVHEELRVRGVERRVDEGADEAARLGRGLAGGKHVDRVAERTDAWALYEVEQHLKWSAEVPIQFPKLTCPSCWIISTTG